MSWRILRWRNALEQIVFLARRGIHALVRLENPLPTEDRRVLEKVVLSHFAAEERYRRVLFVGTDWYTKHYEKLFDGRRYWTLEKDPSRAKYGAERHVTDVLENLGRHFAASTLDLVVCNGVVGWGLNDLPAAEAAFSACYDCLAVGGVLVIGWNDVPRKRPFLLGDCAALNRFRPFVFPPLGSAEFRVNVRLRHTFTFFLKEA